jgi:hypothetical protein
MNVAFIGQRDEQEQLPRLESGAQIPGKRAGHSRFRQDIGLYMESAAFHICLQSPLRENDLLWPSPLTFDDYLSTVDSAVAFGRQSVTKPVNRRFLCGAHCEISA